MLKIRLRRVGAKKKPQYRVVVADSHAPRDGAFVEILGQYNPRAETTTFAIDEDRTREWLRKGAQPTERVARLLGQKGVISPPPIPQTAAKPKGEATQEKTSKPEAAAPSPAEKSTVPSEEALSPEEAPAAEPASDRKADESAA